MELTNDFRVGVPPSEAWEVLTDIERIAPCMPGAELQERAGDEYLGTVKVKVGPITAHYKGGAHFVERDDEKLLAVLKAEGRETRGQGNARATITAQLEANGDGTTVSVSTDLHVTGRVAQFGRGVMAEVSSKLMGQFAECLEHKLANGEEGEAGVAESEAADSPKEPVDLLKVAAPSVGKRLLPVAAVLALFMFFHRRFKRRRTRRAARR